MGVDPRDLLTSRLREVLNCQQPPKRKLIKKTERLISEYSQPGRMRELYENWISFCKAHGFLVKYIDVSSRQAKAVSEGEALNLVG